ncbi:hypothetical protein HMPREF1544_03241 [Mucor circinelloides 1006PhL]|uniref:Uncharacterized protein n=1 Tax=Mucor circinelloides f. circinelloides (strain 1006PhL) TaxID=1220926 RepID=S2JNA2_MUCC1|nr:hypothetical protein HMPREF1544_03241 [Mucor circinelloides 1006PhL]
MVFKSTGYAVSAGLSGSSSRLVSLVSQVVSWLITVLLGTSLSGSGLFGAFSGFQVWFLWCLWSHPWFSRLLVMLSLLVSMVFKSVFFGVSGLIPGFSSLLVLLSLVISLVL